MHTHDPWEYKGAPTTATRFGYSYLPYTFGSDVTDAIIAYRTLWNPYVMASIQAMDNASQSVGAVAANPPSGYTSDQLQQFAQSYATLRDDNLKAWNQFANLTLGDMTSQAKVIITAYQGVVGGIQKFWQDETSTTLHAAGNPPPLPSSSDQSKVNTQAYMTVMQRSDVSLAAQGAMSSVSTNLPSLPDLPKLPSWMDKTHLIIYAVVGGAVLLFIVPKLIGLTPAGMIARRAF